MTPERIKELAKRIDDHLHSVGVYSRSDIEQIIADFGRASCRLLG